MGRLPLIHAILAALVDHALGVAEQHVVGGEPHGLDEVEAGDASSASPVAHEPGFPDVAPCQPHGVQHAGRRDDGGAVLVVVEHRDVHQLPEPLLDDEALRRLDVLEVDAAKGRAEVAHRVDKGVGVLGVDLEIDGIDVGESFEQDRLALHDGLGGQRPQVAQAEDGRAIGDHRHHVAARRQVEGGRWVLGDGPDGNRHPGRIGQRQVALRGHRLRGDDFELARPPLGMELQRFLIGDGLPRRALGGRLVVHGRPHAGSWRPSAP